MLGVTWNPLNLNDWMSILNGFEEVCVAFCSFSLLLKAGLCGLFVIDSQ
jgi:hypothetical protein